MAACLEPPWLFLKQLPTLDLFWAEAAVYHDDSLNMTATMATVGRKLPYEMFRGRLPPINILISMRPDCRCVYRFHNFEVNIEDSPISAREISAREIEPRMTSNALDMM